MQVYEQILSNIRQGRKMLAVLLDPEKAPDLDSLAALISESRTDLLFVGGSGYAKPVDDFVEGLRRRIRRDLPIVLFPGDVCQFSPKADALLFLSLLSCRDGELLVGRHIRAAKAIRESGIEVIPMGYILIDGGSETTVQRVTHTRPLSDEAEIVATALAGEMLGKRLIYLEAGSGALRPVSEQVIRSVRQCVGVPLIVGGGIRSVQQMQTAFRAGADIVVIGNHFETHPEDIVKFSLTVTLNFKQPQGGVKL